MTDLADLYQELILDHGKAPRNHREMSGSARSAEGFNPLCGDRIRVFVKLEDDTIADVSFLSTACAICTASASMMTQHVKGGSAEAALAAFEDFQAMVTATDQQAPAPESLGKLAALAGVRKYPMRVKCATLPWHTLKAALESEDEVVSTE